MEHHINGENFSKNEVVLKKLLTEEEVKIDVFLETINRQYQFDIDRITSDELITSLKNNQTPIREYQLFADYLYKLACAYADLQFIIKCKNISEKALLLFDHVTGHSDTFSFENLYKIEQLKMYFNKT